MRVRSAQAPLPHQPRLQPDDRNAEGPVARYKIRPPMPFSIEDADVLAWALAVVLLKLRSVYR